MPRTSYVVAAMPSGAGDLLEHEASEAPDVGRQDGVDDPTEECVAEVAVLERDPRWTADGDPAGDELGELLGGLRLVAVSPRVVGEQPAAHGHQVAHGQPGRCIGDVARNRVVETEHSAIAKQEDGGGRERLRHRRDPQDALRRRRRLLAGRGRTEAAGVQQLAVAHDRVDQPGRPAVLELGGEQVVNGMQVEGHETESARGRKPPAYD